MGKKLIIEEFIERVSKIHEGKYDYSLVNYINNRTKIKIICHIHGMFEQTPSAHIQGQGCPSCATIQRNSSSLLTAKTTFKTKINTLYKGQYETSEFLYINNYTKGKLWCNICHTYFWSSPNFLLKGEGGCPTCGLKKRSTFYKLKGKQTFEKRARVIHDNQYEYFEDDFTNMSTKTKIWCNSCQDYFWQTPTNHVLGQGCPKCRVSKGERQLRIILKSLNYQFEEQKLLKRNHKRDLKFDFYLSDYDLYIEYQGEQHYEVVKLWGGEAGLLRRQERDQYKKDWCQENSYHLLEIKYTDFDRINKIITNYIEENYEHE